MEGVVSYSMHQWKLQDNPACDCGNATQTIQHIVSDCPKRKFEGKMSDFFTLTSEACKQAYDSVDRERLWETLRTFDIPMKIIRMVKLCNSKTYSRVKFGNEMSTAFEIKNGLRQEDAMSPILFNTELESVIREISNGEERSFDKGLILAYANDIIITGNTRTEVQMNVKKLMKASKNMGLVVNVEKTKYMIVTRRSEDCSNLKVENSKFEQVKEFKYLGVTLNNKNIMHEEINVRLNAANRCYFAMGTLFKSKKLSIKVKEKLYVSYIIPVLTYACATWSTTKVTKRN